MGLAMMKRWIIAWMTAGLVVSARAFAASEPAEGFRPLFAAEGVPKGWVVRHWADVTKPAEGDPVWTVKDGILTSGGNRGCWLLSEKEYGDFTLEYEFKLGPSGNSGLAMRCPPQGDPAFDGMELQMADWRYHPAAEASELSGGIYRALAPRRQVYKPEQWNHLRVTLKGTRLTVDMNGETIQDTDLAQHREPVRRHDGSMAAALSERPRKGRIGFQNLSREGGQVMIRGARIRENQDS